HSAELAHMIERAGGVCVQAPALREVPLQDDPDVRRWVAQLASGGFEVVIYLTGVGCSLLLEQAERDGMLDATLPALAAARVVARGPKPLHVLHQRNIR